MKDAFSYIINYYNPYKESNKKINILDSTCSEMLMWNENDLNNNNFNIVTNDIRKNIEADHHYCCSELHKYLDKKFHIIIYDPPYINLKNRNDSDKYNKAFNYESMNKISDLEELTILSSMCFHGLIKPNGVVIAKITNIHYPQNIHARIRGSYDLVKWMSAYFYLWDEIIYRFYKHIPNIGNYNLKFAKTHTYFLIFKPLNGIKLY